MTWRSLLELAVTLVLLLLIERWIHRHLQGAMLLLTGDREIALVLYALPLMPGILLHEISHALMAKLLGVHVGRVSIRPKITEQRVELGFVPVERTDVVRASLIGLAPLLMGSLAILLIGYLIFGVGTMQDTFAESSREGLVTVLSRMPRAPDFWLWAYVIFTVSNTMLPSRSDRRAWTPVLLFLLLTGLLAWMAGAWPTIVERLNHSLNAAIRWLTVIYILTAAVDLPFVLLIALSERMLGNMKGMRIEY